MRFTAKNRHWYRLYWVFCLGLPLAGAATADSGNVSPAYSEAELHAIDTVLARAVTHSKIPGVIAGMTSGGETLFIRSRGLRQLGRPQALEPNDLMHIGSCTKAMTATLAAIMVEAQWLSWEDVPDGYVEPQRGRRPAPSSVTFHRLFTHQAGIKPLSTLPEFDAIPPFAGDLIEQRSAFSQWLLTQTHPGHGYSNGGYAIGASMMESALGQTWEDLMIDYLFDPLGMAAFYGWPGLVDVNQPWGHWPLEEVDGPLVPQDPLGDYHIPLLIAPAGDVCMRMADLLAFLREHIRGLRGESELLTQETFAFLHTPAGKVTGSDYACGWTILPDLINGITFHMHGGSGGTFLVLMMMAPEADFAVAVAFNAATVPVTEAANEITIDLVTRHIAKIRPREEAEVGAGTGGGRRR